MDPEELRRWEVMAEIDGWDDPSERFWLLLSTIWNGCMSISSAQGAQVPSECWANFNDFKSGSMEALFDAMRKNIKKKLSAEESEKLAQNQQNGRF